MRSLELPRTRTLPQPQAGRRKRNPPSLTTYQPVGTVQTVFPRDQEAQSRPARGNARSALLEAAHSLVRKQGWAATSVDQLCAAAGVTKGAFFHHFASKEELGLAAARHWSAVTAPIFAAAAYHQLDDPLDRVLGYLDFRAAIAEGPLESFTCFAGTVVQEVFATSDSVRVACGESIGAHAAELAKDFRAAIARYRPPDDVTAESLARYAAAKELRAEEAKAERAAKVGAR